MIPAWLGAGKEHRKGAGVRFEECVLDDELRLEYFEVEVPLARSSLKCRREVDDE